MIVTALESVGETPLCGRVIVALGDSITEGVGAAPGNDWPSRMARRLKGGRCGARVLNAGIGGNRLVSKGASPSLLSRFDRDVLAIPGVTDIILLEGINDIRNWAAGPAADAGDAGDVLDAYRQIVARAHAHGIRVIGGTITPHRGATNQTAGTLAMVEAVNGSIRRGEIFDSWIDFAAAIADPRERDRMRPEASSGDWLHPSDRGYELMAAAVPLALFDETRRRER
jgi:lysophospholipase L1-like esterase